MALKRIFHFILVFAAIFAAGFSNESWAQDHSTEPSAKTEAIQGAEDARGHKVDSHASTLDGAHGEKHETPGTFAPHYGTWLNPIARALFGQPPVKAEMHDGKKHFTSIENDFIVVAIFIMMMIALLGILAARSMKLRPDGKPFSLSNVVEASAESFRNYLVGVMGEKLAYKYAPLISSFFFTILLFNYMGQIPGMTAPTANPNVPISFAIIAFFSVHIIAIKEAGFKSWFMHLVGEPIWLAPLNFPLHLLGELIKPLSLAMRLLGNIFGEEMVVFQLIGLAIGIFVATNIPIPIQLPIMFLGLLFGLLQALVFSTLLAIYISILGTNHHDHDAHDDADNEQGHVEHHTDKNGNRQISGHPTEITVGA